MNSHPIHNSIYSNIILSKTAFFQFYKTEIDELFNLIYSEINKKNIKILCYDNLYYDFVDFVYRFSIKNRPKI